MLDPADRLEGDDMAVRSFDPVRIRSVTRIVARSSAPARRSTPSPGREITLAVAVCGRSSKLWWTTSANGMAPSIVAAASASRRSFKSA